MLIARELSVEITLGFFHNEHNCKICLRMYIVIVIFLVCLSFKIIIISLFVFNVLHLFELNCYPWTQCTPYKILFVIFILQVIILK